MKRISRTRYINYNILFVAVVSPVVKLQNWRERNAMASAGVRACNGGLEEPPAGLGAEPLVRGSGVESPQQLQFPVCFWTLDRPVELVVFSVFHSVQRDSARGTEFPLEKRKGNDVPPRPPQFDH